MPLELDSRQVGDVIVVRCRGRIIEGSESQSLHTHLRDVLSEQQTVVLHLAEVQFVDSSGLGALVRLHATAKAGGSVLKLCSLSPMVRQVLQFTNLNKLFEIYESESEAVSAFYRSSSAGQELPHNAIRILCVDSSPDVLAYLREFLRGAGYRTFTSSNLPDAQLLLKAARTHLVIVGPNLPPAHHDPIAKVCGRSDTAVPLLILGSGFSSQEAGAAGELLLQSIRSRLQV
jgi:anti-sigma B factor antagonist